MQQWRRRGGSGKHPLPPGSVASGCLCTPTETSWVGREGRRVVKYWRGALMNDSIWNGSASFEAETGAACHGKLTTLQSPSVWRCLQRNHVAAFLSLRFTPQQEMNGHWHSTVASSVIRKILAHGFRIFKSVSSQKQKQTTIPANKQS